MDDLAAVAASVAKALGLELFDVREYGKTMRPPVDVIHNRRFFRDPPPNNCAELEEDGSNLFYPSWQIRCRDWLLERGQVRFVRDTEENEHGFYPANERAPTIWLTCPAAEFCARAIHQLTSAPARPLP